MKYYAAGEWLVVRSDTLDKRSDIRSHGSTFYCFVEKKITWLLALMGNYLIKNTKYISVS